MIYIVTNKLNLNLLSLLNNLMKLKIGFIILFALTYSSQCKSFLHKFIINFLCFDTLLLILFKFKFFLKRA